MTAYDPLFQSLFWWIEDWDPNIAEHSPASSTVSILVLVD